MGHTATKQNVHCIGNNVELASVQSHQITSQLHSYGLSVLWLFRGISIEWAGGDSVSCLRTLTRLIATAEAWLHGLNMCPCGYRKLHLTKPLPQSICFSGSDPSNHLAAFLLCLAIWKILLYFLLLYLCFLDNKWNTVLIMHAVIWLPTRQWWIQRVCIGLHFTVRKQTAFDVIYFVDNSGIQRTENTIVHYSYAV